jgi:DMSO/TMAO reductase YedYZ heme-binding membrane subunit
LMGQTFTYVFDGIHGGNDIKVFNHSQFFNFVSFLYVILVIFLSKNIARLLLYPKNFQNWP